MVLYKYIENTFRVFPDWVKVGLMLFLWMFFIGPIIFNLMIFVFVDLIPAFLFTGQIPLWTLGTYDWPILTRLIN